MNIERLKTSLELFYRLKYENGNINFNEITEITLNINLIESWLKTYETKDKIEINISDYVQLLNLLDKYYRNDYPIFFDDNSLSDYLSSKYSDFETSFLYYFILEDEQYEKIDALQKEECQNWITRLKKAVDQYKKLNRWDIYQEKKIIDNISFESFQNEAINITVKKYFAEKLDFIFSRIYLLSTFHFEVQQPKNKTDSKKVNLSNIITHTNSIEIVEGIKIRYKNIKGKQLKLLLMALQDLNLLSKERIASKFHRCCETEFDWDIGKIQALNGYKFNDRNDSQELNAMKKFLETFIR